MSFHKAFLSLAPRQGIDPLYYLAPTTTRPHLLRRSAPKTAQGSRWRAYPVVARAASPWLIVDVSLLLHLSPYETLLILLWRFCPGGLLDFPPFNRLIACCRSPFIIIVVTFASFPSSTTFKMPLSSLAISSYRCSSSCRLMSISFSKNDNTVGGSYLRCSNTA